MLAVEVVTANGDIRLCSKDENCDLFWAARGAGPGTLNSFGKHVCLYNSRLPRNCHCISSRGPKQLFRRYEINFYLALGAIQNCTGLDYKCKH